MEKQTVVNIGNKNGEPIRVLKEAILILSDQRINCQILENTLSSQLAIFDLLNKMSNNGELSAATSSLFKVGNSSLEIYSSLSSCEFFSKINSIISIDSTLQIRRYPGNFWNADTQFYRKRADYHYNKLFSKDSLVLEQMIFSAPLNGNSKKVEEYPIAFIVLSEEPNVGDDGGAASVITPEEKFIDLLFFENLFGLPTKLGILVPIFLNEKSMNFYYKQFPMARYCSAKLSAYSQSSGMNFTYFELSPLLKILILSRVSKILQIMNSLSKSDPITNIICLQYLLSHIRSCAIAFNIFNVNSTPQTQDDLLLQQLVTFQIFISGELLFDSLTSALNSKLNRSINLLSQICGIIGDYHALLPTKWISKIREILIHSTTMLNFPLKTLDECYFGKDDNRARVWAERIRWLALFVEQRSAPEVFCEGIFNGEVESVTTTAPSEQLIIVPQQLRDYLVYAIKHFQTTQDRSIIIEWIQLTKDILEITLRVIQRGLSFPNTNKDFASFSGKLGWWNDKSWNDYFPIVTGLCGQWFALNINACLQDKFIPRCVTSNLVKTLFHKVVNSNALTNNEYFDLKLTLDYYFAKFNLKICICELNWNYESGYESDKEQSDFLRTNHLRHTRKRTLNIKSKSSFPKFLFLVRHLHIPNKTANFPSSSSFENSKKNSEFAELTSCSDGQMSEHSADSDSGEYCETLSSSYIDESFRQRQLTHIASAIDRDKTKSGTFILMNNT